MTPLTLYVYRTEDDICIAEIEGADNAACEAEAERRGYGADDYAWTYSPAFGFVSGLKGHDHEDR
jgi:hypothetical protein